MPTIGIIIGAIASLIFYPLVRDDELRRNINRTMNHYADRHWSSRRGAI